MDGSHGSYHVALDLSREQVKRLRMLSIERGESVRELVTRLVTKEMEIREAQEEKNNKTEEQQN